MPKADSPLIDGGGQVATARLASLEVVSPLGVYERGKVILRAGAT